jgi:hypothetical protein
MISTKEQEAAIFLRSSGGNKVICIFSRRIDLWPLEWIENERIEHRVCRRYLADHFSATRLSGVHPAGRVDIPGTANRVRRKTANREVSACFVINGIR